MTNLLPLDAVTLETFTPHVGQAFDVLQPEGRRVTLTLTEATPAPTDSDPRRRRAAFSLIFRPTEPLSMPQGMYRLERDGLGAIDMFLVPILPDRDGARIQAVFA
jgi:hypothetical protein